MMSLRKMCQPILTTSFPLRIYTALKPCKTWRETKRSLFPLRIYTALKPVQCHPCSVQCLFPLRIYTALKPSKPHRPVFLVCFPYEFTLLSNGTLIEKASPGFVSPTNLHCSQTLKLSKNNILQNISLHS